MGKYMVLILSVVLCINCISLSSRGSNNVESVAANDSLITPHRIDSTSFFYKNYEYLIVSITDDKSNVVGQDIYVFKDNRIAGKIELPFMSYIKIDGNNESLLSHHLIGIKSDAIAEQEVVLLYGGANIYCARQEFLAACSLEGEVLAYWIANQYGLVEEHNIDFFRQEADEDIPLDSFTKIE